MSIDLKIGEPHPASTSAMEYIKTIPYVELIQLQGSFSSCSLSDNRLAEVCSETLRRLLNNEPVSDRYLLGLCWTIKTIRKSI